MLRPFVLAATLVALVLPGSALPAPGGADVTFDGGTRRERTQVRAALGASAFDWRLLRQRTTVHIGPYGTSRSTPGQVWLDAGLLHSGRFAWATVMDEFAHQIDYVLLDEPRRRILQDRLGAPAWCYEVPGLDHAENGCERFASMVAWAYWPSKENAYRPRCRADETSSMTATDFRTLLAELIGEQPTLVPRQRS